MASRQKTRQQRQQIIEAIDDLLYEKGFNLMSFSDIAEVSGVPRGNIYYYFKTKDEVLQAVIEHRLAGMQQMLEQWEKTLDGPLDCLRRYAEILLNEGNRVTRYGCPMGSLNTELGKVQPALQKISRAQFDLFKKWLKRQFKRLQPNGDAEAMAMHLLVHTQGIATMANVYGDKKLIARELAMINDWLEKVAASVD
jgi:AcrR family transcriptional regulator